MGLSLGINEATQLHALLSVHKPNNSYPVTNQGQTVKEVTRLVTHH